MLTLLRHPELLDRLRHEPEMAIGMVEELLRYEPPVHLRSTRIALDDIDIAGTKIPKGAPIVLALAAGSRDPEHVPDPDRFDPDRFYQPAPRVRRRHPLLLRRAPGPRGSTDRPDRTGPTVAESPPRHRPAPYRPSPELRGPRHLLLEIDGVAGPAR